MPAWILQKRANVNFDYIHGILSNFRIYDHVTEVPVALDTLKEEFLD